MNLKESTQFDERFLVAPAVLWYVVFLVLPLLLIITFSFFTHDNFQVTYTLSLDAWNEVIFGSNTLNIILDSLILAFISTVAIAILAFPAAYYMRFYMSETASLFLLLFLVIVFWTAEVIRMIGFYPILGSNGVVNYVLLNLNIVDEPVSWLLFSSISKIFGYINNYILFMIAPIFISMARIDRNLLNASETLRANPLETFRYVVWPRSLPGTVIGFIFVFVLTVGNLTVPTVLGSGNSTATSLIYSRVTTTLNFPVASAITAVLLLAMFALLFALIKLVDITQIYEF